MVTDDQMLQQGKELGRELRETLSLLLQHGQTDVDVTDQHSLDRVPEGAGVGQFVDLADVVQDGPGDQQIPVEPEIADRDELVEPVERNDMLKKTSEINVVQRFGGGRYAKQPGDLLIFQKFLQELPDLAVSNLNHELLNLEPQLLNIPRRLWEEIGGIDLRVPY